MTEASVDKLLDEAQRQPFEGWDFSWIRGRMRINGPSWDYPTMARHHIARARSMLDLGTGGGEMLASLAPLATLSVATECYRPNVSIAPRRLGPLGVRVVHAAEDLKLRFADDSFDLVLARHEAFDAEEVARVVCRGGVFLTQQVGGAHFAELNEALGAPPYPYRDYGLAKAHAALNSTARLVIEFAAKEEPAACFKDVGAVVYYLRATPWQIPDFSVERYRDRLGALHERIARDGAFPLHTAYFILGAVKSC
jgi:SAM-dependent methyltransferase